MMGPSGRPICRSAAPRQPRQPYELLLIRLDIMKSYYLGCSTMPGTFPKHFQIYYDVISGWPICAEG